MNPCVSSSQLKNAVARPSSLQVRNFTGFFMGSMNMPVYSTACKPGLFVGWVESVENPEGGFRKPVSRKTERQIQSSSPTDVTHRWIEACCTHPTMVMNNPGRGFDCVKPPLTIENAPVGRIVQVLTSSKFNESPPDAWFDRKIQIGTNFS